MDDVRIERVLRAAECVPAGKLATYGDIAKVTGESPRVVGNIMAKWGSNIPWWRICNAKGEIAGHFERALPYWQEENIARNTAHTGVVLSAHRVAIETLEAAWRESIKDL